MSKPSSTDNEANFPKMEEGRVMPVRQQNTTSEATRTRVVGGGRTTKPASGPPRTTPIRKAASIEAQTGSNQSAGTKAKRNGANRSGQLRRKAKTGMSNNR